MSNGTKKLDPCKFRDYFWHILYQIKLCGISNNNQFTHRRSAPVVNTDVIKMATIALLIRIYTYIEVC